MKTRECDGKLADYQKVVFKKTHKHQREIRQVFDNFASLSALGLSWSSLHSNKATFMHRLWL